MFCLQKCNAACQPLQILCFCENSNALQCVCQCRAWVWVVWKGKMLFQLFWSTQKEANTSAITLFYPHRTVNISEKKQQSFTQSRQSTLMLVCYCKFRWKWRALSTALFSAKLMNLIYQSHKKFLSSSSFSGSLQRNHSSIVVAETRFSHTSTIFTATTVCPYLCNIFCILCAIQVAKKL